MRIQDSEVGEELGREYVVPAQGLRVVGEAHVQVEVRRLRVLHGEDVFAVEYAQVQTVIVIDNPVGLGVDVMEEHLVALQGFRQRKEEVDVSASRRHHETCLVLDYGAFKQYLGGDEAYTERAAELLHVAVNGVDVQQRGQAASILGRNISLVQVAGLDGVVVEN